MIAKEYGKSPEEIEQWDAYWFNRAVLKMEAEAIESRREISEMKRRRK